MAEIKTLGDKAPLDKKPRGSPAADPKSGAFKLLGEPVPLSRTPVTQPLSDPASGKFNLLGSTVDLNRTPIKGWGDAASLPMSERVVAQAKGGAGKKGRKS